NRRHRHHDEDADRNAHNGERRSHLVRANRVDGHPDPFERVENALCDPHCYSLLSASIGSRDAALRAGYTPEMIPTTVPSRVAMTMDQGAIAAGRGVFHSTTFAMTIPSRMPMIAPSVLKDGAWTRNW